MIDESMSLIKYVPNFARGFNVLLIHDDKNSLWYLSWVLELYSFKVTATNNICSATSMICCEEGMFKLVMTKANMPDMDALSFLDLVLEEDVPVIFINSGVFDNATRKALGTRLCYFLQEPISPNDLKYLWQHVYHPRPYSAKNTQNEDFQSMVPHAKGLENTQTKQVIGAKRGNNDADIRDELKGKRIVCDYTMPTTQCLTHKAFGKRNHDDNLGKQKEKRNVELEKPDSLRSAKMKCNINEYSRMSQYKKRSTVWTPELHRKFLKAVEELGEDCARPKQILVQMNINGPYYLTVRQVASHLQKYRLRLQYEEKSRNSHLSNVRTSSCSGHKAKFPRSEWSPLETKAFGPGLPAPKVFLNENRNQDQIPVNNMGMKFTDSSDSHPIPDASLDINIPDNEFYDLVRTFVEDCDCFNLYDYETNPAAVDECTKMLRKFLDGKSSS